VESEPSTGSTFTLYLPLKYAGLVPKPDDEVYASPKVLSSDITDDGHALRPGVPDDRETILPDDKVMLLIEDDAAFATVVRDIARGQGFKVISALDGETGLKLAQRFRPHAINLDLKLPDIDGWKVLDELKRNPETRHIPVQVVSVIDRHKGTTMGAISYLEKPVTAAALEGAFAHVKHFIDREVRELLIVEDDEVQRNTITELVGHEDVKVTAASTGAEGLELLDKQAFDCVVLDLSLPDMGGLDVLKKIKRQDRYKDLPVLIYTGKDLSRSEENQLKRYATSIILKGADSSEPLLDQTSLFLHRVMTRMAPGQRDVIERRYRLSDLSDVVARPQTKSKRNGKSGPSHPVSVESSPHPKLAGRRALIVDDDVRNIFALTSVLESQGMEVLFEESGANAIRTLSENPNIDVVLMDVMMPEMDGYETMSRIRQIDSLKQIPIVALTAKAMAGDREKCLEAGASDYITKPVDTNSLFEMIEKWVEAPLAQLL